MSVWFTSDHHLQHRAMAWMRKYGEWPKDRSLITPELVADHDQLLADMWDRTVRKDDVVWVLGDLTANAQHVPAALDWVAARPGTKHLILGNHDSAHPKHREAYRTQREYFRAFDSVSTAARRRVHLPDGSRQEVLLSHFPYTGDGEGREDRCAQWRLPNEGLALLHGHIHSTDKVTYGNSLPTDDGGWFRPKQIHVGLDAWGYTPVSLQQVVELLDA